MLPDEFRPVPNTLRRWIRSHCRSNWLRASLLVALALPVGLSVKRTLIRADIRTNGMGKTVRVSGTTIRVSEEFYERLEAQQNDEESLEETFHRVAGGPHPAEVAGILTPEEAEEMKEAAKRFRRSDKERKKRAREAFSSDE